MALPPYTRVTERFQCNGLDLNSPVDATRPGYYPILENVRSYTEGVIQPRQGLSLIATVSSTNKTHIHSIRRLNDPNTGNWIRLVGVQDTLSFMNSTSTGNAFTRIQYNAADISISGNPLSMTPFQPDQSVSSWMYVADSSVMRKIVGYNGQSITGGTAHQVGLPPPTVAPVNELAAPAASNVFQASSNGTAPYNWSADGTVLSTGVVFARRIPAGQTATKIVYVSGSVGWASIVVPQAVADVLGVGQFLNVEGGFPASSPMVVHEVFRASSTGLTVSSILYDSGASGNCTIVPSQSVTEIQRNAVVLLNGAQYARIMDVVLSPDGSRALRCNTTGTISAGQTFQVVPTFFAYDSVGGLAAGNTIEDFVTVGNGVVQVNATGGATKTGWVQITTSTPTDLSQLSGISGAYLSPAGFQDDDFAHTSILVSDLNQLTQGRIMFDVDTTSLAITSISTSPSIAGELVTTTLAHNLSSGDTVFISGTGATVGTFIVSSSTSTSTFNFVTTSTSTSNAAGTVQPQFKKNFYYRAFTPNDLVPVAKGTQTAQAGQTNVIGNQPIDFPNVPIKPSPGRERVRGRSESDDFTPSPRPGGRADQLLNPDDPNAPIPGGSARSQSGLGDYQWSELRFRKSSLQRVGQGSQTLAKTNAMRVEFTFNSTGPVVVGVNSNLLYGGYTLDTSELGIPYQYRYRYRVQKTGAASNWSPASISGLTALRDQASITMSTSTGQEVDTMDIQRLGGTNTTWLTVGTKTNDSTAFTDKTSNLAVLAAAPFSDTDTNYQLWPTIQKPAASSSAPATTTIVGPYLKDTNAPFNTAWAKGTPIKANGVNTQIRRVVSTSVLEMDDSLGAVTNPTWEVPAPLLTGQPLPCLWVWNTTGFACGDNVNPQRLYFTNPGSLDTTQDTFWIDITSPSEPLQNGCSYNGKNYVWSSERLFEIDQIGPNQYLPIEIPGMKGMIGRWGLAVGERLWWIARDGIYQSAGGDAISITDETLRPLFVQEGNAGQPVNGFNPPDLTVTGKLRLSYYDGYLYFIYQDTAGALRCLSYYTRAQKPGWWPDKYLDGTGVATLYGEEGSGVHSLLAGGNNGPSAKLYQVSGSADDGAPIASHIRTRSFDAQDRRANKYWGDLIVDADSTQALTLAVGLNNHSTTATLTPAVTTASTTAGIRVQSIVDIGSSGAITKARNLDLDITWTSTGTPKVYLWEPSYIPLPEGSNLRPTYWDDLGVEGDKFVQGIEIETDTSNTARTILVEYDGGTLADTLTVQHNGNQTKAYSFHPAFIAHMVRLRPTDSNGWENFKYRWIWSPESPLADHWETQQVSFGADSFVHMREVWITMKSTQAVTMTLIRIDDNSSVNYTVPTTSGLRLKQRIILRAPASKGKTFLFQWSSTGVGGQFRLYKPETAVLVKPWSSDMQYAQHNLFGAESGKGNSQI